MGTEETALELTWLARATGARSATLREVDFGAGSAGLFQEVTTRRHRALPALDRLPFGVVLLDGASKPVHPKRAAACQAERLCLDAPSADPML